MDSTRRVPAVRLADLVGHSRLSAFLLVLGGMAVPLSAQSQASIEILEPAAWQGQDTRGIGVRQRLGLRVEGIARSEGRIDRVTLNGAEAALTGGENEARFVGYVTPTVENPEVLVEAYDGDRLLASRRFPVVVEATDEVFDDPTSAWGESSGFSGERWAVVIGISEYQDPEVPELRYADDDAMAFYNFLTSPAAGMGGFNPDNIRLLLNEDATYREIRLAFRDFLKSATEDDVVFIFFAGHGAPDRERPEDLYLVAHDTEYASIAGTGFPMEDVNDAIRRTYARTIVSFIDACHSAGVGGQTGLRAIANPINQAFLGRAERSLGVQVSFTASQVNQYSQEGPQWGGGHGVFTYHLLRSLEGAADVDGDGIVTLGESLEWTRDRVRRETRSGQIPSISQTAFDSSWPMSIGDPALIEATPTVAADADASTGRVLTVDRSGGPARTRPAQGEAGNGLLVVVYGDGPGVPVAEESVLQRLSSRREVRVMDVNSIGIASADHPAVQSAVAGDFLALTELMRDQGGEFLFVGNLQASATPAVGGQMFSGRAQLELRMYRVSTGEVVDSRIFSVGMDGQPAKLGGSEYDAVQQAAREAGTMAGTVARGWLVSALR